MGNERQISTQKSSKYWHRESLPRVPSVAPFWDRVAREEPQQWTPVLTWGPDDNEKSHWALNTLDRMWREKGVYLRDPIPKNPQALPVHDKNEFQ